MNYKMNYDFGKHYPIKPYNLYMDEDVLDGHFVAASKQFYVGAVEKFEDTVVNEIIKIAEENNITDVYLLNKPKIVEALEKAMPINRIIDSNNILSCPKCGYHIPHATNMYCGNCGQHFVPALEVKGDD